LKIFMVISLCAALVSAVFAERSERKIVVDLSDQRLRAYEGERLVFDFHCSTGRKSCKTPVGEVKVQKKKETMTVLPELGGGKLPYALQIYMYDPKQERKRRLNIHGSNDVPLHPDSSGCVRLAVVSAEKLFEWAKVDDRVIIQE
jgi:lipoprotein-anchoring transpeptidase ErfK/SrfK